jgi:hypothetical protein
LILRGQAAEVAVDSYINNVMLTRVRSPRERSYQVRGPII